MKSWKHDIKFSLEICKFGQKILYQPFYNGCNGRNHFTRCGIYSWGRQTTNTYFKRTKLVPKGRNVAEPGIRRRHLNLVDPESLRSTIVYCNLLGTSWQLFCGAHMLWLVRRLVECFVYRYSLLRAFQDPERRGLSMLLCFVLGLILESSWIEGSS